MGWVIQGKIAKLNHGLSSIEKFVLLTFSSFATDDGSSCYPAVSTVSKRTMTSDRTVQRAVKKFVKAGVMIVVKKPGRQRPIKYQIDIARAEELYYRPDDENKPDGREAEGGDSLSGKPSLKGDSLSGNAKIKGDTSSQKGVSLSQKGDSLSLKGDAVSGNPINNPFKKPIDKPSAQAGARDVAPSPACARWKEVKDELLQHFKESVYKAWIKILIPEHDDGETLTLAVATKFFRDHVTKNYLEDLQKITSRKIQFEVRSYASQANSRASREGEEDNSGGLGGSQSLQPSGF